MPHSLRAKLSGLRYKKIITDKDYQRLCNALYMEKSIDNIKSEIKSLIEMCDTDYEFEEMLAYEAVLGIIDKHIGKEKDEQRRSNKD